MSVNPIDQLKESGRYIELEAIPLATNMEERTTEGATRCGVVLATKDGNHHSIYCYVFEDGTRTKLVQDVIEFSYTQTSKK